MCLTRFPLHRRIGVEDFNQSSTDQTEPLLKITDLRAVSALAKERGILSIIDNTFMPPSLQRPIEYGIDVVIHSATKYLGGHSSESMMGTHVFASDQGNVSLVGWLDI
jgi:cystathionine beta-lyase/cystathionine gamma-synthase